MVSTVHCPHCGSELSAESDTCSACGKSFDSHAEYKQELIERSNRYLAFAALALILIVVVAYFFW